MFDKVDLYCERIGTGLWAEPVNALTNITFLIAAWLVWRHAKQLQLLSIEIWLLITLMASIAIGSGLFHTYASGLTRVLDIVPILLFQLVYLWVYLRRVVQTRLVYTVGFLLIYFVAAIMGRQFPHLLNGSLIYAPTILVLIAIGLYHFTTQKVERYLVLVATSVFFVSLICRTIDNAICTNFPLGTHFMWHICNAIMLYLLMRAYLLDIHNWAMTPSR